MKLKESLLCWLLAFSLSWTNLTNGWQWIAYSSISDFTAQFYQVTFVKVNWISLLNAVIMTVGAVPFIWFIDRYGIKPTLTLSAALNLLCAVIHVVSSSEVIGPESRYTILVIGSIFGGFAQPLCMFSSTKLAAAWFSPQDRVSANTLAAMGNPLGILLSNLLSPTVVTHQRNLPLLNLINLLPPAVGMILVLLSTHLAPKPLRGLSSTKQMSFAKQLKAIIGNFQFCVLVVCFGILLASFTTISTLIQQMLCPLGYSDFFSGLCGALFLAMGIPGVLIVGPVVTRTGALKEVVKWGMLLTSLGMIAFSIVSTFSGQPLLVALSVVFMGFVGFGIYPSSLELAAETAHPAGEVFSTGLLISVSQLFSFLFILASQAITAPASHVSSLSVCSIKNARSYWISNIVLATISVVNSSVFLFAFTTKYKRVESEAEWSALDDSNLHLLGQEQ